jgi:rare lipoprotein A
MLRVISRRLTCLKLGTAVLAAIASLLAPAILSDAAEAKTPGHTYCFNGTCHRVNTIAETASLVGEHETLSTSYYDDCQRDRYNPCGLTSSGEVFNADAPDNAASPIYPDGTVLLVRNGANGKSAVVRVNNAGPYHGKRKLDVSRATAEVLGFKKRGVAKLQVRVVTAPTKAESRYKKNRHYTAVPGFIGAFASLDQAQGTTMVAMGLTGTPNLKVATADGIAASDAATAETAGSPADELRAVARRTLGIGRGTRVIAPPVLTAEAIYSQITSHF